MGGGDRSDTCLGLSRHSGVKIPLLVEVEAAAGFQAGLEDLERFVARAKAGVSPIGPPIELPLPVATEADNGAERELVRELPVLFRAREIAIPARGR